MSNIYKRYTIPVTSLGPDGVQRVVDNIEVECHDHMRMGELGNEIFSASNIQQGNRPTGNPNQDSSGGDDQTFSSRMTSSRLLNPKDVASNVFPKGRI